MISNALKQFMIDTFNNEEDFNNLCRELRVASSTYSGNFAVRMNDLLSYIEKKYPDYIDILYKAGLTLKPTYKSQIHELFTSHKKKIANNNHIASLKNNQVNVFISYSWHDIDKIDIIDLIFKENRINLIKEVKAINYNRDPKDFLNMISQSRYIIVILSKHFIESESCMFEILTLMKENFLSKEFIPILLDDINIYSHPSKTNHITFWENKYTTLQNKTSHYTSFETAGIEEDLEITAFIKDEIGNFLDLTNTLLIKKYNHLQKTNFMELVEHIKSY